MTNHLSPAPCDEPTFSRTVNGTRVHLPQCPHLHETEAHAASAAERLAHRVCDWSTAQLEGYGREHFDGIEGAMRRIGVPAGAQATILQALRFVEHDEVFVVHSLTYGAVGYHGRTVAGFGRTYYWVGARRFNLPDYVDAGRSGHNVPGKIGKVCPTHNLTMNLLGTCDFC